MKRPAIGSVEDLEIDLLIEGLYRHSGFDFRGYARSSLRRRVRGVVETEQVPTVSALQDRVLHDPACLHRLLLGLSVHVSAMFRDPRFFLAFRRKAVPLLRTYPFIRIWQAGCSTGEEVYSLAILLQEEGLYDRCRIYATDMNEVVLQQAREGIFPLEAMQRYTANYHASGGTEELSSYYTAAYDSVIFRPSLRERVVFSQHNLASDGPFNEFNVILCRNVMIYFGEELQARVHDLFARSLTTFGLLGLGSHESIQFGPAERRYEPLESGEKLFRRVH
ncbi:MAG TPA: protein-glutamate O-methyltransferase CheR [Vicinamibacterales bacterium]|nr:protein-glutamate O-methyltransferase CheR [Vicinamibacterales bacterium]